MKDEYLWDRSGPPDPEVARIEQTLASLRYRHRPGTFQPPRRATQLWRIAVAAAVLAGVAVWQFRTTPASPVSAWQVTSLYGSAQLGGQEVILDMPLGIGQTLRTGTQTELTLHAGELGRIDLGPDSELRAATSRQVLLNRGLLHAYIWAPPRQFVVDTPSARAVDLGCEYTLNVDNAGNGLLRVSMGWVAFQFHGHEAFIPAGAECVTRKRNGPGTPYYQDAPEPLRRAVDSFETGDPASLDQILASARPRDGLTLWHLLTRVPPADRGRVFDRLGELIVLPAEISRDAVLRLDPVMVDLCWDALNLENTGWWRGWERKW